MIDVMILGQGFGSSNTSGTDINDHIAKEVMKTFGDRKVQLTI